MIYNTDCILCYKYITRKDVHMKSHTLEKPSAYLCPRIINAEKRHIYYGGDQAWFSRNTAFRCGCGPICGANVLTVFADRHSYFQENLNITINSKHMISQEDYLHIMQELYKSMLPIEIPIISQIYDKCTRSNKFFKHIPAALGVTLPHFTLGVLRYAASKDIYLKHRSCSLFYGSYMRGLTFINLALANGYPVVLLTTNNTFQFKTFDGQHTTVGTSHKMFHHCVTITDIKETGTSEGPELTITTWGKVGTISYRDLYRSWNSVRSFGAGMVYFTPAKNIKATKLSMLKTLGIFFKR